MLPLFDHNHELKITSKEILNCDLEKTVKEILSIRL